MMRLLCRSAVLPIFLCLILAGCGRDSSQYTAKNEPAKQPAPAQQQQATPAPAPAPAAEPATAKAPESKPATPAKAAPQSASAKPQATPTTPAPAATQSAAQNSIQSNVQNAVQSQVQSAAQNAAQKAAALPAAPPKVSTAPVQAPVNAASAAAKQLLPKDVVILKGSPMGGVKFEHKLHVERAANKCETCHHVSKPEKAATAPQQACSTCHTSVAAAPMKTKLQAAFHNPTATAGTCLDCHKTQNAAGKAAPTKCLDCHKKTNI
jgi:class III cytochrome C family protein